MNYFGASINQSPTIAELAGSSISNGAFLLVKYDENGTVSVCDTEGELAAGVLLPETTKAITPGTELTVQIKSIGLVKAGAAIKKGQEIMTDSMGRAIPATSGKFVIGYAMQTASEEDELIQMDIRKSGYKA